MVKGLIRSIVAIPKKTYKDENTNINYDMSYITPRVIVSAGPVNHLFKKWYWYPVDDLVTILNSNHDDNWHIWNLRGEKMGYYPEDVKGKVSYYPFPDHQPPPFELLIVIIEEIYNFLAADVQNTALIHCKAGKGRSGTICCALLMFLRFKEGEWITADKTNIFYTTKRLREGTGLGVSIKSQLLYLKYWETYINLSDEVKQLKKLLVGFSSKFDVVFHDIEVVNLIEYLRVDDNLHIELQGYSPRYGHNDCTKGATIDTLWDLHEHNFVLIGNRAVFKVAKSFQHYRDFRLHINSTLYIWFNVVFCDEKPSKTFKFEDIDGFKGSSQRGAKLFDLVTINWSVLD